MKRYILIVAGGKGLRMGHSLPKQFIPLAGKPVLMHTMERFFHWDPEARIILVLPEDHQDYWKMLCRELDCRIPHLVANGGETRFHSVKNGLLLIEEPALVGIHDGVRPFVDPAVIEACFAEAEINGAAIPVLPIVDSLRGINEEGGTFPVDRNRYVSVQTPQVFQSRLLLDSYNREYQAEFTDDASVVEASGYPVYTVQGNPENIKITTSVDLILADTFLHTLKQESK